MSANSDVSAATYRPRSRRVTGSAPVRRGTLFHRLFLSRYSIGAKLLLSTCILTVPLAAFGAFCTWIEFEEWQVAVTETQAIYAYEPAHEIVRLITQSPEFAQARKGGGPIDRAASAALLKQIRTQFDGLTGMLTAHTHEEGTLPHKDDQSLIEELDKRIAYLAAGADMPTDGTLRYSAVVKSALALEEQIAFEGGLFRDNDEVVSEYSDVGMRRIPRMLNELAEVRAIVSTPNVSEREARRNEARLQYLAVILSNRALESQQQLIDIAHILRSRDQRARKDSAIIEAPPAVQSLRELPNILRAAQTDSARVQAILALVDSTEQALAKLQDQLVVDLRLRLEQRRAVVARDAWIAFVLSVPTLIIGAWLTYAISSRTAGGVRRLLAISNGIALGQYDHIIDERGSDELSRLFAGFAEMQRRLSLQIGTERAQLVISNRIRAALDNVAGNVLVGAASGAIVHVNKAARIMFQEAQRDIQTCIPEFDLESLHGTSLDTFCDTLIGQSMGLTALSETLTREFQVGERTFRMVANPVLSEGGERFGTVVELTDRTIELAVERELQNMLAAVVDGKLDKRIPLNGKHGFFETMSRGVNQLAENMSDIVLKVKSVASRVRDVSNDVSAGNSDLSQRFASQSESLDRTAALMISVTQVAKRNADSAGHADELVTMARGHAERGGQVVQKAVSAMAEINDSAGRIADIISVVDEIAFQTNLLALNAAVEAARAGEQGRGFAVVASEVRNLAGRSAAAAKEIKGLIEDSVFKVEIGSALVRQSGETLEHIVGSVGKVSQLVAEIAAASREQTSGIEQVNEAMGQIEEMTQRNASVVKQAALSSEAMAAEARELTALIERFRMESPEEWNRMAKPLRELASVA